MANIADKVSEAEVEILKVFWANGGPMTDRQIRDALSEESGWRKTTIQTLVKRLVDKGVLLREKRDVFYYTPAVSVDEFAKARTEDLVNKVFGGNARSLVSAMLNNDILSEEDIDNLKSYWQKRKAGK